MKKRRLLHSAFLTCLALAFSLSVLAQQAVRGTLRSSTGEPLAGATVSVKGTTNSVSTNAAGEFTINAPTGSTLVVSYVGYTNQEVAVTGAPLTIQLQATNQELQQVVVIGYQTVRRRDLTGATGVVNMENVNKITSQSVAEAIQGTVPGVTVRNGGAPGSNATIEIRGASNFGQTSPLYVIDGMLSDANTTVNPDDVASIQILKDASAAAIYGARASNGVVIITTKKGREGAARISVSARGGVQQIPKRWNVMDAAQFLQTVKQQYQNSNTALPSGFAAQLANNTINTDWQDEIYRTGKVQDYNVGISGGSQTANFLVSAGYYKNEGVLIANDFQRASLRINSEARKGRLTFGENMMISNSNGRNPGGGVNAFYDAPTSLPIIAVRGSQYAGIPANPGGWGMGTTEVPSYASNYVANAALDRQTYNFAKLLGNAYVDLKLSTLR